jgi:hypothetical protein
MSSQINPSTGGLPIVAAANNFALTGGTPTILSWTAPATGGPYAVLIFAEENVTSAMTGGQVTASVTTASGNADAKQMFAAGNGVGVYTPFAASFPQMRIVEAGTTVSIFQNSPLTVGAASVWAAIAAAGMA